MNDLERAVLSFIHISATIGWLGGVFFILAYVHPAANDYFKGDRERDLFLTVLANGARWHVMAAFVAIGVSGAGLAIMDGKFDAILVLKVIALAVATAVFSFETWYLWPRRVFATVAEIPAELRKFRLVGVTLFVCGSIGVVAGTVAVYG